MFILQSAKTFICMGSQPTAVFYNDNLFTQDALLLILCRYNADWDFLGGVSPPEVARHLSHLS